jgi:dihydrofolate synthase/folylpolyglutamate synthase
MLGAKPIVAGEEFSWQEDSGGSGTWSYRSRAVSLDGLSPSALSGAIQYRNASTAIAAVEALGFAGKLTRQVVMSALANVKLSGRFQTIPGQVEWILDVAHNEPAARVFAEHLAAKPAHKKTYAVVGILADKDSEAVARLVEPYVDHWIVCTISDARGLPAQELAARMKLSGPSVQLVQSTEEGLAQARALAKQGDRVIVFGGFYIVGSAMRFLSVQ